MEARPGSPPTEWLAADGRLLASCGDDGLIKLWDLRTSKCVLSLPTPGSIFGVRRSPDGNEVAGWGRAGIVQSWDLKALGATLQGNEAYWREKLGR